MRKEQTPEDRVLHCGEQLEMSIPRSSSKGIKATANILKEMINVMRLNPNVKKLTLETIRKSIKKGAPEEKNSNNNPT